MVKEPHGGFVKLWRKLEDNDVSYDPIALTLLIHFWINAQHESGKYNFTWNGKPAYLNRGQLIFSRRRWSKRLKIPQATLYKAFIRLCEKYQICSRISNRNLTVVTLLNWNTYQSCLHDAGAALGASREPLGITKQECKNEISKDAVASQSPKIEIHNHITNSPIQHPCLSSDVSKNGEIAGPPQEWRDMIKRLSIAKGMDHY